ncbi:MAG: metallophosphoesterase [Candidatus Marsarchaeota archaeon]|nr:metallophosphoesterase [Candidatus Marsarchaeota archaeon]
MKIAIVSDLHLGYDTFRNDAFNQAKQALDMANELADAVLIPGDIFDRHYPKPDVIAEGINLFRDLSKKKWGAQVVEVKGAHAFTDVPMVAIPGNHETTVQNSENPLSLLALAGLLIDTSHAHTVLQKGAEKVAIYGFGSIAESSARQKLLEVRPKPMPGVFNIFLFHQTMYELMPFNENFMRMNDLPADFDLYVCGHMHNFYEKTVHDGKKLIIPGSTVLTQLNDIEKKKGFIMFDTELYSYEFIEISSRPFLIKTIEFDNADDMQILNKCIDEIDELAKGHEKPIIKIHLKGSANIMNYSLLIQKLKLKYSESIYLSIDASQLADKSIDKNIEELRDNRIGEMPIKQLGNALFMQKLKDLGFDFSLIDANTLYELLSQEESKKSKEKAVKESREFLNI